MGKIKCPNCVYESDTWSVKRHFERKHKEQSKSFQHVSKPHPYVHQQGGQAQLLPQQYNGYNVQLNKQTEYRNVNLHNLDLLKTRSNIEYLLQNVDHFLGCFPLDGLPPFPEILPKSMIINTQPSGHPGEHWVALVLTVEQCFYFGSFALPRAPANIEMYVEPYYNTITYLEIPIQDITSNFCGAYCVSFVLHVKDDLTYEQFFRHYYSDNQLKNDEILKQDLSKINFLVKV